MSRAAIDILVYLLDQAFEGNEEHSLLGNLTNVTPEDWLARPVEGGRTIRDIVDHAGVAKHLYWNHTFGDSTYRYDAVLRESPSCRDAGDIDGVKAWLRDAHGKFRAGVAALDDAQLRDPRTAHWGGVIELRRAIAVMIDHDVYHAGEINHLRAQRQDDDRWPWEPR